MATDQHDRGPSVEPLEAEPTAPRRSRPSPVDARSPSVNAASAVAPLFESNTGRLSPVPRGSVPPRDSAAPRNSAPPRQSSVPRRPIRAGQVVAVVLVLVVTMLLGAGLVAWIDRGPVHHPTTTSKSTLDAFSLASVYDFFFPPPERR